MVAIADFVAKSANVRRRNSISLALVLLFVYLALSPLFGKPFYQRMLFQPEPYPSGFYNTSLDVPYRDVFFRAVDGSTLHGWYFKKPGAQNTVLIHHGQGGNLTDYLSWAKLFLDNNNSVFTYDYRGYGRSTGEPSVEGLLEDGDAAYHYLRAQGVPAEKIIACGVSLGTGVASELTMTDPHGGIVLITPYLRLRKLANDHAAWLRLYPNFLIADPDIGSAMMVSKHHPPLLIIHGDRDSTISVKNADELYKLAGASTTYVRLPEAGHEDLLELHQPTIERELQKFMKSLS